MKYILVTGYSGYIGSHVCKELKQQGYGVIGIDRVAADDRDLYAKYVDEQIECNIDYASVYRNIRHRNIETVIHCAATSLVGPSVKNPDAYYQNNVSDMNVFLNMCRDAGVKRIVYSSSAATYGDGYTMFTESIVNNPISPYGRTKMIGEWMIEDYCNAYNMSAVALRYFNVCGADFDVEFGQKGKPSHIIAVSIIRAINGESITINGNEFDTLDGTCERDYVHVVDVAKANVAAVEAEVDGFVAVNIGSGIGYSNLDIVKSVNEYTNYNLDYSFGPGRDGDPARLVCSNTAAKEILGWSPKHSDLKTIITSAEKWHEKQIKGEVNYA